MPPQQPSRRSLETFSIWALLATLVVSVCTVIPFASMPLSATKGIYSSAYYHHALNMTSHRPPTAD